MHPSRDAHDIDTMKLFTRLVFDALKHKNNILLLAGSIYFNNFNILNPVGIWGAWPFLSKQETKAAGWLVVVLIGQPY